MALDFTTFLMFVGFIIAAYSIVANDAIQTLGTFISSNSHRAWWVLWLYACSILVAVLVYGWFVNLGDVSYGRLEKFPEPASGITWIHAIPPIFIVLLTRYGIPVSTTFLILTVFAPTNMQALLTKSLLGYLVALVVGLVVYFVVARIVERRFQETSAQVGQNPGLFWIAAQWLSTGFLWSQWLIQDLANIFVYLPRALSVEMLIFAVVLMLFLHAIIFARRGGEIQGIVTSKTNTQDIRSATIVDFIYGFILLFFKEYSNMPMSTTWVFLGLLAGREFALAFVNNNRPRAEALLIAGRDVGKAGIGLAVSVALAFGLPAINRMIGGEPSENQASAETESRDLRVADRD